MNTYRVYIIKSLKDLKLYVGVTSNLEKRIQDHNCGRVKSTKSRRPFILVHSEEYSTLSEARKREWFLKYTPQGGKLKRRLAKLGPSGPKGRRDPGP